MGGAPVYVWPGGGITVMVDVTRLPRNAFGYVPTPAIVAPMEFTLPRALYERLGGHVADIVSVADVIREVGPERPHRRLARRQPLAVRRRQIVQAQASGSEMRHGQCQSSAQAGRAADPATRAAVYMLEDQVGFLLRCAHQRATEIFNAVMARFARDADAVRSARQARRPGLGVAEPARAPHAHGPGHHLGRGRPADRARLRAAVGRHQGRAAGDADADAGGAGRGHGHEGDGGRGVAAHAGAAERGGGDRAAARRSPRSGERDVRAGRHPAAHRRAPAPVARADRRGAEGVGAAGGGARGLCGSGARGSRRSCRSCATS